MIIGSHLSLSSVILWLIPQIYKMNRVIHILSWIFICWFIIGVISAVCLVWILVVKNRELKLKDVNKLVHENN